MLRLSKRLLAVAALAADALGTVEEAAGKCLADVGTDHGYIPIYLLGQGHCSRAIAMDIKEGPLARAGEHIREHGLTAYIETRLSDGLAGLEAGEAEVIVIAGMGGATMSGILEAGADIITMDTELILQPQSEILQFRRYLIEQGFTLIEEQMVTEDGKFYPMMRVRLLRPGEENPVYDETELAYGPLLLAKRHPVLKEYLLRQQRKNLEIRERLERHAGDEIKNGRLAELERENTRLQWALHMYGEKDDDL